MTGCSGGGKSKSYKLGQYDGPRLTQADASPAGIASACAGQFGKYRTQASNTKRYKALKVNSAPSAQRLLTTLGQVSTPDFTMQAADVSKNDYLKGCETALRAKLR